MDAATQIQKFTEFIELSCLTDLLQAAQRGDGFLVIDFGELAKFDPELSEELLEDPENVTRAAELAVQQFDLPGERKEFRVRFAHLPQTQKIFIRDIRSKHINKFVFVDGIVRQKSDVRPQVTTARFECPSCGQVITVLQLDTKFNEPSRCGCGRKGKFKLLSKELVDAQRIVLEEVPEELEGGEQPKRIDVFLKADLVSPIGDKKTNPGTRIVANGIVREVPIILRTGGQSIRYDLLVDANYVEPIEEAFANVAITPEEEEQIKALATDPNTYGKLIGSMAPSIYGLEKIKEAVMLQLMGGVQKKRDDGVTTRGDMHVLLIGDPGAAKSQLLKRAKVIAPRARYVSGKGVSGAGITAAVVRDEFLKGWALEAGALVLASGGLCCIDELDKMNKEDRDAMHEALEQQSYHYDTEIMLSDGSVHKMGELVDTLIAQQRENVVLGKDCEVLPTDALEVLTTDFTSIFPTKIQRVSRHKAPKHFIEISYSHGRKIVVTPEHPIFISEGGNMREIPAALAAEGMLAPAPRKLPTDGSAPEFAAEDKLENIVNKDIRLVRITGVQKIPNTDSAWVYDVTVEPTRTFISEGLVLHNTVTISKANIQATLRCETTVLAAANPKHGRFDPYGIIAEQIDLPPTLINRFDLIFPIKDLPDLANDTSMAGFILKLHQDVNSQRAEIDTALLRKYIAYARRNINPKLSDAALEEIREYYVRMRSSGIQEGQRPVIPITARQLEALVRLSEAIAKVRFSGVVEQRDAQKAIELLDYCLTLVGLDRETGRIDIDRIATGISASQRNQLLTVKEIIHDIEATGMREVPIEDIIKAAQDKGISQEKVDEIIDKLKRSGDIFEPKHGMISRL